MIFFDETVGVKKEKGKKKVFGIPERMLQGFPGRKPIRRTQRALLLTRLLSLICDQIEIKKKKVFGRSESQSGW